MKNNIIYERKDDNIEYIYYKDAVQSYPTHTHANHVTFGYVLDGVVCIICNGEKNLYHAGKHFRVLPSMVSICAAVDKRSDEAANEISCTKRLKQLILEAPERTFLIDEMAKIISMSSYHMIRKFKEACGLTPHQFQIQCRIRKAQKLLEEEKRVIEAAYATGFCDQSHFDRCFYKIVGLTPSEYKQSVKRQLSIMPE